MSGLTAQAESDTVSEVIFGGTTDVYLALHTSDPGNSPDGTTEVTDSNYSRLLVQESDFSETGDGPTVVTNTTGFTFDPFDTAVGDITHLSLCDGGTAGTGDMQLVNTVSPVRNFEAGDFPNIESGEAVFEVD